MKKWVTVIVSVMILTGCWDQRLVKDINLIYSQALDLTEENRIETTIVTIGGTQNESGSRIGSSQEPAIISAVAIRQEIAAWF